MRRCSASERIAERTDDAARANSERPMGIARLWNGASSLCSTPTRAVSFMSVPLSYATKVFAALVEAAC